MQSSANKSKVTSAISSQKMSQLYAEKVKIEGMFAAILGLIDMREGDLDQELENMMRNQNMNEDDLEFVGLIRDAIGHRDDIKMIDVWISQGGINDADYGHKIIKSLGLIMPRNQSPPKNRDSKKDEFIEKYKEISNHPYAQQIRTLLDEGFADLTSNVKAIDKFSGNLMLARHYLSGQHQEEVKQIQRPVIKGRDAIMPEIETPLPPSEKQSLNEPQDSHQPQHIIDRSEPQNIDIYEEIKESQAPVIVSIDQLRQQVKDDLQSEGLDSIDDVKDLILEKFEQDKGQKRSMATRRTIMKYQALLDREIEIQTRMMNPPSRLLKLDSDEELTKEDLIDLLDSKKAKAERASKNGDITKFNKASGDIAQYKILIEIYDEIDSLKKAKAGIQDAPVDPRILYPTLQLKKRMALLSKLQAQNNLVDYQDLISQDRDIENLDEYQSALKSIRLLMRGQKWEMVGVMLFNTFLNGNSNRHYAMKIYYMQDQQHSILSPIQMAEIYEQLKSLEAPENCKEIHSDIIESFTRFTSDYLQTHIDQAKGLDEGFGAELDRILQPVMPKPPEIVIPQPPQINPVLEQTIQDFSINFGRYSGFQKAQQSLVNDDVLASASFLRQLMSEIKGNRNEEHQFCEMYFQLLKVMPDLQAELSAKKIYSTFSPKKLQNAVKELFKNLQREIILIQNIQEEQKDQIQSLVQRDHRPISDLLKEIYHEDPQFSETLLSYFKSERHYSDIVFPLSLQLKSLKELQLDHLQKAYSQIDHKNRDPRKISDFIAINIDIDQEKLPSDLANLYLDSLKLNGKTLTLLLFEMIKRKSRFQNFLELLSQVDQKNSEEMLFTEQFLLQYLLSNSDTYLRTMILQACSSYMPLPLVTNIPKNQNVIPQPNQRSVINFEPKVFEELFYCFEKHMAVLTFKVTAIPNKSPQGCTSLTNYVFNRSFATHSQSLVNYGTIEIQFDHNFDRPMQVPVADAHGLVDEEILELVYPLFNIFIIHAFSGPEYHQIVKRQISKIKQNINNPLIFVITHDIDGIDNTLNTKEDGNFVEISFSFFKNLQEINRANLRKFILNNFFKYIGDQKSYEENIPARLKSLQEYTDFVSRFRAYNEKNGNGGVFADQKTQLTEALDITRRYLRSVDENKDRLRSDKVVPMNVLFQEACHLENIMIRDTSLSREACEEYRQRIELLYQKMQQSMYSPLTQELRKIIDHKNLLCVTSIISKFIRSIINFNVQPLYKEREELRSRIQEPDLKLDEKSHTLQKIEEINKILEKRQFSNEILYREFYISEMSKQRCREKLLDKPFSDYISLANLKISQGQQFELIDGNNLQFIKEVYQMIKLDRMQQEEILVVSMIGPQSSGKSLLLSQLFGVQFPYSVERCSRGIYGCLLDIKSKFKKTRFKKILILDTQGIQSNDPLDEEFDKRVVFFILCVSHIVLICNQGKMDKKMEDTIKLATDRIWQVRELIDQQPQVNIIMNNVKINENSLYKTIQSLQTSMMDMKRYQKEQWILTINQSNVFQVPNAFDQSGKKEFVAYQPSDKFAYHVEQLKRKILIFIEISNNEDTAFYTLESWFKFAQKFWELTNSYADLTEYITIEEKNEKNLLNEFAKKLIADNFENPQIAAKHKKIINDEVAKVLHQNQDSDYAKIKVIKTQMINALQPQFQEVETRIQQEFRKFIYQQWIHPQIAKKMIEQVDTQIRQNFFDWKQIVEKLLGKFFEKKNSQYNQDKTLQNVIDRHFLANNANITVEEALKIFNIEWNIIESEKLKYLISAEQIQEDILNYVRELFLANTKSIINFDRERALIAEYLSLDSNIIVNVLRGQEGFFYYNSKTVRLTMEQFKQKINREKHFLSNKVVDYFQELQVEQYYNWMNVVKERFNFAAYEQTMIEACQNQGGLLSKLFKWKENEFKKIINMINEEAEEFNVDITDYFQTSLTVFEESIKNQRKALKGDYDSDEYDIFVQNVIKQHVNDLKNNIASNFKYKRGENRNRDPSQMRYFDNENIRDFKTQIILNKDNFSKVKYIVNLNPADQRQDGLEPFNKNLIQFAIKPEVRSKYQHFAQFLELLVQQDQGQISSNSMILKHGETDFFAHIDHDKMLKNIQSIILQNIFRNSKKNLHTTVEQLVQELIISDHQNNLQNFSKIGDKTVQRILQSLDRIVAQLNEDMEPFRLRVSENGVICLHLITRTYIVRIMQEVQRLQYHAPLLALNKTKGVQRDLFIAKLTSNDKDMDTKLAERTAIHLAQIILKQVKDEEIQAFRAYLQQSPFTLKTISKDIENQVLQISVGKTSNIFMEGLMRIDYQQDAQRLKKNVGVKQLKEEEKKQEDPKDRLSMIDKVDVKVQFQPDEMIMFYVNSSEFLNSKFNDQWEKLSEIEIKRAQHKYQDRINKINLNFQEYFYSLLKAFEYKKIRLATEIFLQEGLYHLPFQYPFKVQQQKAMATYFGLLVTKEWKAGTAILLNDQVKMITPLNLSLVIPEDIRIDLLQPYASILHLLIQNEQISNIENFIQILMREISSCLNIQNKGENSIVLQQDELIGNFYQIMKTNVLGCDKMCPLCRKKCDQDHSGVVLAEQIHKCDQGHQTLGLGGNRHENKPFKNKIRAITIACHELDNQDTVIFQGQALNWKTFKDIIFYKFRWDLNDNNKKLNMGLKHKNAMIWNSIGPFICDYYSRYEKRININFVYAEMDERKISMNMHKQYKSSYAPYHGSNTSICMIPYLDAR